MNRNYQPYNDWDDSGVYGTGRTDPPKNRGGLIAILLILIIFLCGLITLLGVMNIRLFQKLHTQQRKDLAMSFTTGETQATEMPTTTQSVPAPQSDADTINLEASPIGQPNIPMEGSMSLQEIYTKNINSVVSIICSQTGGSSSGTGVILTENGLIVTNAHVVEKAGSITALLTTGEQYQANLVGMDEISDLAVLRIHTDNLSPAQFGDSSTLRVGDAVVAIGDPLGVEFRGTYTNGIISGIDRDIESNGRTMTLIQTNAALNSGNSGGPLINCYGQVIGINTMKIGAFTDKAGVEGLGFAIPSTTVKEVVDQLISQGYVSGRPTLGIAGDGLSAFYQHYYQMPAGVYITDVSKDSDAYAKGIEDGDIILSVNNTRVTNYDELKSAIFGMHVGDTVQVIIFRSGKQYQVDLVLTEDRGSNS